LVAGPIERSTHLLPQIKSKRIFQYSAAIDGLRQVLWGLFKKIVIADNCSEVVNLVFANPTYYSSSILIISAVLFAFQIYCDFSGYSDIALGVSRLLGIELLRNFDENILNEIEKENLFCVSKLPFLEFEANTSKEDYTKAILQTKNHILDGDVYELNYCIEFHKKNCPELDIVSVYLALNAASPTPFSALYANTSHAILCASPERFLLKIDNLIYSQPIKGTILRKEDKAEDELMKLSLLNSEKERAENLMIVDLVRNDLAKSAKTGSVQVEELFGIYSFKKLHQMISTVRAELNNTPVVDCIQNAFPMGSMTGAPKIKAMEIIDELEKCKRGMYSGSIGYISPNLDFDLNVVIRSLQYNSKKQYLSFQVGSAITIDSDAQAEYEECLLKGSAMMNLFSGAN
jgi:para-aminobenzoate synthetase component 1